MTIQGDAHRLPFVDNAFDCIVSQEVFEHLEDPFAAANEVERVLVPGGVLYLQVPFIIGYHSLPHDYYRFTKPGLRVLVERAGLRIVEIHSSVGFGTSIYRIMVEVLPAMVGAFRIPFLYETAKAIAAVLFAPVRWLDMLSSDDETMNRIHGGYYVIAQKNPE